ncbi:MAG: peptidoglycan DD-metalloendopeptidase family protein [Deltaproteobacteria bacterium]|nr:peptidoglycan DD-metalloendopeptidase family protein [Deltaproteobacteria bacterium]
MRFSTRQLSALLLTSWLCVLSSVGCRTTPEKAAPKVESSAMKKTDKSAPQETETAPAGTYYEVERGDTLWSIARAHGVAPEELVELNGLDTPEMLQIGQLIFLPDEDGLGLPVDDKDRKAAAVLRTPDLERAKISTKADLMWPLKDGVLLREFSKKATLPYEGILLAAPAGTPVSAAANGHVVHVGEEGAYGMMIILRHSEKDGTADPNHLVTIYTHLDGVDVEPGDVVPRGQIIGRVGSSGRAESSLLHFQVREGRTPVNPLTHLPDD